MKSVMAPFYTEFPELADNETRCLTVLNDENLPKGKYAFIESYCDDIDCDCRRVLLSVHCPEVAKKKMLATISYGWERASFYKQFCLDGDDPKTVKGPYLDPLNPQSKYAPYLLELFKTMLKDRNYVERLKRHYKLFKKAVKEKQKPQETAIKKPVKKIGRNEPCPCGSGKKYKKCCGR